MQATPTSRTKSSTKTTKTSLLMVGVLLNNQVAVDSRKRRRCPAVRFAASRRPRAIGWARRLRVSIHTITGIRAEGVPCGTKWLSRLLKAR